MFEGVKVDQVRVKTAHAVVIYRSSKVAFATAGSPREARLKVENTSPPSCYGVAGRPFMWLRLKRLCPVRSGKHRQAAVMVGCTEPPPGGHRVQPRR